MIDFEGRSTPLELFPKTVDHNASKDALFDLPGVFRHLEPLQNGLLASDGFEDKWMTYMNAVL